jgi:5'(3')-deoxyribonucleotidase
MKIAVDIDAVLGDLISPILKEVNKEYLLNLHYEDITEWEFCTGSMNISKEIKKYLQNPDFVLNLPLINGAKESIKHLSIKNKIIIATSRPKETEKETIEWCNKHFSFHKFINFNGNSKKDFPADVLIDDYIKNIEEFVRFDEGNRYAIAFKQPWNQNKDGLQDLIDKNRVICCGSWEEIVKNIKYLRKFGF